MLKKYERLVVLQTAAQSIHYSINRRKQGDLILTVGSEAMHHAKSQHWHFCFLGDFFDVEHYQRSRIESQRRVEDVISDLNGWSAAKGLEVGNYYGFQLWIIIGQIHYNYFILKSIARNVGNKPVLIYTKKHEEKILEFRPDPERVFFNVLAQSNVFDKIKSEAVFVDEKREFFSVKERMVNALPSTFVKVLQFLRDRQRLPQCKNKFKQKLLLIGGGYDWFKVATLPKFNKEYCIEVAAPLVVRGLVKKHDKELSKILDYAVTFDGEKVYDLKKLKSAIHRDYRLFASKKKRIQSLIKGYKAVVTGVLTYPLDLFYADMAAKLGKKLYVWQHGDKGQSADYSTILTELYYATDYLSYAPWVSRQYRKSIGSRRLERVHTVGSISKKIEWFGGGAILYATGKWFGTAVPFLDRTDPDQRLFLAHTTILDYLNSIGSGKRVIFKANNTPGFNLIPYQYENIDIEHKKTFTELLKTACVVILDTPSTTLVEACSTKVPVFVLGGRGEYRPEFMRAIRQRVAWYETPAELVGGLSEYFAAGTYDADVSNDVYLKGFCSHISKDEVCQKVLQALR